MSPLGNSGAVVVDVVVVVDVELVVVVGMGTVVVAGPVVVLVRKDVQLPRQPGFWLRSSHDLKSA